MQQYYPRPMAPAPIGPALVGPALVGPALDLADTDEGASQSHWRDCFFRAVRVMHHKYQLHHTGILWDRASLLDLLLGRMPDCTVLVRIQDLSTDGYVRSSLALCDRAISDGVDSNWSRSRKGLLSESAVKLLSDYWGANDHGLLRHGCQASDVEGADAEYAARVVCLHGIRVPDHYLGAAVSWNSSVRRFWPSGSSCGIFLGRQQSRSSSLHDGGYWIRMLGW